MDDPNANRAAIALLLLIASWTAIFVWFNPLGWAVAAGLAFVGLVVAPPLP